MEDKKIALKKQLFFLICACIYPLILLVCNIIVITNKNNDIKTAVTHRTTNHLASYFKNQSFLIDKETEDVIECVENPQIENKPEYISTSTLAQQSPVEKEYIPYQDEDFIAICRIVEAETHGANEEAKIHIVSIILNRVKSPEFPNTIQGVCYQSGQFAYRYDVEKSTIDAVTTGLNCEDTVQGALFFCTCKGCWADTNKEYIFTDNVGHNFYK